MKCNKLDDKENLHIRIVEAHKNVPEYVLRVFNA